MMKMDENMIAICLEVARLRCPFYLIGVPHVIFIIGRCGS
uniref:Uncharacterized protein n=1 Tax=Arundo donax TaxID=35708 RepID=A0A0A9EKH6_ARUDO